MELKIYGLKLGEIKENDNIPEIICQYAEKQIGGLREKDIIVITSKIISKARGYIFKEIIPSKRAIKLSKFTGKPLKLLEAIIRNSKNILAIIPLKKILEDSKFPEEFTQDRESAIELLNEESCIIIAETKDGRLATDAGVDMSNVSNDFFTYPPPDPDKEASRIRGEIKRILGIDVAVIISDTEVNMYRYGSTDIAIGASGIEPVSRCFASLDRYGKRKFGGVDIIVDEIASAAALLMGQTSEGIPVVVIRGLDYELSDKGVKDIVIEKKFIRKGLILTMLETILYRIYSVFV